METRQNWIEVIKTKAEAVQMVVSEVQDMSEALRYAVEITRQKGGNGIAAPGLAQRDGNAVETLEDLCQAQGVTLVTENVRDRIGEFYTGFTVADWGIAETATLVQESQSEDTRIATMLSEIHVAVLPVSRIRPDAAALEEDLKAFMQTGPGYLAFISGASRTADIERVLTIGVHGPQELHLLIWHDQ